MIIATYIEEEIYLLDWTAFLMRKYLRNYVLNFNLARRKILFLNPSCHSIQTFRKENSHKNNLLLV